MCEFARAHTRACLSIEVSIANPTGRCLQRIQHLTLILWGVNTVLTHTRTHTCRYIHARTQIRYGPKQLSQRGPRLQSSFWSGTSRVETSASRRAPGWWHPDYEYRRCTRVANESTYTANNSAALLCCEVQRFFDSIDPHKE